MNRHPSYSMSMGAVVGFKRISCIQFNFGVYQLWKHAFDRTLDGSNCFAGFLNFYAHLSRVFSSWNEINRHFGLSIFRHENLKTFALFLDSSLSGTQTQTCFILIWPYRCDFCLRTFFVVGLDSNLLLSSLTAMLRGKQILFNLDPWIFYPAAFVEFALRLSFQQ